MSLTLRPAAARGHADHGWLRTQHSFSFADYFDRAHMGFRSLRVINEDWVAPDSGFDTHGHADMEIVTYIVSGALAHKDSTGGEGVIRRGEVQHMSAGTGIRHSEFNPSADEDVHLLQIWLRPRQAGLAPSYHQRLVPDAEKTNRLRPLASPDGREGSLIIAQDAVIFASLLEAGQSLSHLPTAGRGVWLQLIKGRVLVNGVAVAAGDGLAAEGEEMLELRAEQDSEFLLFDLA